MMEAHAALKEKLRKNTDYGDNRVLLLEAQSEDEALSSRATERLIESNAGLIKSIALRFKERRYDLEDLMQIGTIGMIKAIRSFDLDRGTCFSTYAVPLIFGEIRRYIRDEGPIKIGRQYKRIGVMLSREKNRIISEEGREPHISELAALCGVSKEEAAMALDAMTPIASLSDMVFGDEDGVELEDTLADGETSSDMERILNKIALGQAVSRMPAEWQKIVMLRYYRNYTQQQTADRLGLSQVKVSREEKKILEFLRGEMLR
jgi:RNA polymerase sporulation-specific sigma factor